jgi:hypothetical protein
MKRLLPFFVVLALSGAVEIVSTPAGGDFGAPRLLVPAPKEPDLQHLAWPKVLRAKDGRLHVFCLAGFSHTQRGSPVMFVSSDGGRTFTGPTVLMKFGEGEWRHSGNLAAGFAEDGALVVLAMGMNAGSARTGIFGWRSPDSGRTWQPADTSALSGKAGSVYGNVFAVPGKGLAVAGHFRKGATMRQQGIWISFSKDQGRSWSEAQVVTTGPEVEPAMIYTAGKIVGLIRTSPSDRYIQVVSEDKGATWKQTGAFVGAGTSLPSPFLAADPRDPKLLWALQTDRNPDGLGDGQGKIWLWSARLDKLEWNREGLVARFPSRSQWRAADYGYPWMAHLGGREWLLVFYGGEHAGPNSLWGMKLRVPR